MERRRKREILSQKRTRIGERDFRKKEKEKRMIFGGFQWLGKKFLIAVFPPHV